MHFSVFLPDFEGCERKAKTICLIVKGGRAEGRRGGGGLHINYYLLSYFLNSLLVLDQIFEIIIMGG